MEHVLFSSFLRVGSMYSLSSPTRDWTSAPCSGTMESQPLDHQGSPFVILFFVLFLKVCDFNLLQEALILLA